MSDSSINFTLQRLIELGDENSEFFLERDFAIAKHNFPLLLERREDSLIGRGHHESYHLHVPTGRVVCFLWDEDHDERLFVAANDIFSKLSLNAQGLILMVAERKASLTIVTTNSNAKESLAMTIGGEIEVGGDVWSVEIVTSGPELARSGIINDHVVDSWPYLKNLLETRDVLTQLHECLELRDLEVKIRKKARSKAT